MKSLQEVTKQPMRLTMIRPDRVLTVLLLAVAALFALNRSQAIESLSFTLKSMAGIAPFFLLAVLFAGFAKASGADQLIVRAFTGRPETAILAASIAGALSPFCSCGVIPLMAAMLASGVPLAPVMAFCMSSPIMDPEMFVLTAAGINVNFAVAKTVTALGMGLMAGFIVYGLQKRRLLESPLKRQDGCGCSQAPFEPDKKVTVSWRFWKDQTRREQFISEIRTGGFFLGKWMLLAFFIESLMLAYVPGQWIAGFAGNGRALAIPLAAVVGIPAYMNGYAAIPLISGLLQMGMAPGAALAFATAGAISSIPAALAVYALVRKPVFAVYLGLGLAGSMLAGAVYQMIYGLQFL